jgi:alkanesulfonate monooxygenase SsuD/methylene tetrahydromethanopterin reductase-like flavin-dependent oxidoreductase (luciferase family)
LRQALSGERVDRSFETFRVEGFRLERPPDRPPPIYLAALRERMLRLAGSEADGVLLGLLSAADVRRVTSVALTARATGAPLDVVLRLGVFPSDDAERARAACRRILASYLNAPPYARFHAWLGRGDRLEPLHRAWRKRDRAAALTAIPDEWVDAFFVHGAPESCREQIQAFVEAGVTTPVLQLMRAGADPMRWVRALAPR